MTSSASQPLAQATGILVIGKGRMGSFARELFEREGWPLLDVLGSRDDVPAALERWRVEAGTHPVAVDFTVAGLGHAHGGACLELGYRPLIGTSGVTNEEVDDLDRRARAAGLGGLVVPNFSLAMLRLQQSLVDLSAGFERAEIIELHHARKRDAPSATAQHTRERLAEAGMSDVTVHSVRLPGLYAHQEILLGSEGETLTLRHDMLGPEAFGKGLLLGVRHAARAQGVRQGLEHAL